MPGLILSQAQAAGVGVERGSHFWTSGSGETGSHLWTPFLSERGSHLWTFLLVVKGSLPAYSRSRELFRQERLKKNIFIFKRLYFTLI